MACCKYNHNTGTTKHISQNFPPGGDYFFVPLFYSAQTPPPPRSHLFLGLLVKDGAGSLVQDGGVY